MIVGLFLLRLYLTMKHNLQIYLLLKGEIDMKKCEKDEIRDKAATMSDKELSEEYYNTVYSTLGSNSERMEECGYDARDIKEARQYERYLSEKASLLEEICNERNISLWD